MVHSYLAHTAGGTPTCRSCTLAARWSLARDRYYTAPVARSRGQRTCPPHSPSLSHCSPGALYTDLSRRGRYTGYIYIYGYNIWGCYALWDNLLIPRPVDSRWPPQTAHRLFCSRSDGAEVACSIACCHWDGQCDWWVGSVCIAYLPLLMSGVGVYCIFTLADITLMVDCVSTLSSLKPLCC